MSALLGGEIAGLHQSFGKIGEDGTLRCDLLEQTDFRVVVLHLPEQDRRAAIPGVNRCMLAQRFDSLGCISAFVCDLECELVVSLAFQ